MNSIYEDVALDLYIESNGSGEADYYTERWGELNEGSKRPYRQAAERLVNKYQERFLGGDENNTPAWDNEPAFTDDKSDEAESEYRPTLQPISRLTLTIEGLV